MPKILLVEDDSELAENLQAFLQTEHHNVDIAPDGKIAVELLERFVYDAVILDWELPVINGIDVLRRMRKRSCMTPVIMLTAKDSLVDKETGLDSGADDYLPKPFHVRELSARLKALMRRPAIMTGTVLSARNLTLNTSTRVVTKDGAPIDLLPKEFALLELFMRYPGQLFTPEVILDRAWPSDSESGVETIYTWIKRLRAKVDANPKDSLIKSVYGCGYRMEEH